MAPSAGAKTLRFGHSGEKIVPIVFGLAQQMLHSGDVMGGDWLGKSSERNNVCAMCEQRRTIAKSDRQRGLRLKVRLGEADCQ